MLSSLPFVSHPLRFASFQDLVVRRAARLAAMGTAAVLTQLGAEGVGAHVGIDGSVFKKHSRFQAVSRLATPGID